MPNDDPGIAPELTIETQMIVNAAITALMVQKNTDILFKPGQNQPTSDNFDFYPEKIDFQTPEAIQYLTIDTSIFQWLPNFSITQLKIDPVYKSLIVDAYLNDGTSPPPKVQFNKRFQPNKAVKQIVIAFQIERDAYPWIPFAVEILYRPNPTATGTYFDCDPQVGNDPITT